MPGELSPLFGGSLARNGQHLSGGLARQVNNEVELTAAQAEVAMAREDARALLVSSLVGNIEQCVTDAQQRVKQNPALAPFLEPLVFEVAAAAQRAIRRF